MSPLTGVDVEYFADFPEDVPKKSVMLWFSIWCSTHKERIEFLAKSSKHVIMFRNLRGD
jgi:hypothetical protein